MPIEASNARACQGRNEAAKAARGQPVSARLRAPPRPPSGVRYVGNTPWDRRSTLTLMTALLLAGQAAATTATRVQNVPRSSLPQPAMPRHGFHPGLFTSLTEPLAELANEEALLVAEESVGGGRSLLWQGIAAWFADPCTDLDQYANGFWKLQHPAGPVSPSVFSEYRQEIQAAMLTDIPHASPDATGAEQALALTWASAVTPAGRLWQGFDAQREAIAALGSKEDVSSHLCASMVKGQESVLGFERFFRNGVLVAGLALQPAEAPALYDFPAGHPAVLAHKADIARLLVLTGMSEADAAASVDSVFAMEADLARVPEQLGSYTRAQAIQALPGFPWDKVWSALGLDPMTALFTSVEACRTVQTLLASRPLDHWKAFLRCQEARRVQHLFETAVEPGQILQRLENSRGGRRLLGAWYGSRADPALETRARDIFTALKQVYVEDLAASPLPIDDVLLLQDVLRNATLRVDDGRGKPWDGFEPSPSFAVNLQRLAALKVQEDLEIIEDPAGASGSGGPAHHLVLGTNVVDGEVFTTPALLHCVQTATAPAEHEWATLGAMLGHELGHLLGDARGVSAEGEAMMEQENAAIRQRIGDLWVGQIHLDAQRVLDEAGCDLRGLSAARRAGEAEAAREGRAFDHRRFFLAAAGLHAANPTQAQLRTQVSEDAHPPAPFRAELGRSLETYDKTFRCGSRPTVSYDRMFTLAAPVQRAIDPNTG